MKKISPQFLPPLHELRQQTKPLSGASSVQPQGKRIVLPSLSHLITESQLQLTPKTKATTSLNFTTEPRLEISPQNIHQLQSLLEQVKPGTQIVLQAGIYTGNINLNDLKNLHITAESGAIIKGSLQLNHCENLELENLRIEGTQFKQGANVPELILSNAHDIHLKGLNISHNGERQKEHSVRGMLEIKSDCERVQVSGSHFYSGTTNEQFTPERRHALVNGIVSSGREVRLSENHFENVYTGIVSRGEHARIEGNQISLFSQDGINISGHHSQIIGNRITDFQNLSNDRAHHDGIQAWASEPEGIVNARYTGHHNLKNIDIRDNLIMSTTNPSRAYQGPLQGIVAFDGYMDGWLVSGNTIQTHSTRHGISINGPRSSSERPFVIEGNTILGLTHSESTESPEIILSPMRYKQNPADPHEKFTWAIEANYQVKFSGNNLTASLERGLRLR